MKLKVTLFVLVMSHFSGNAWAFGSSRKLPELTTVPAVQVEKYLGTWYEIASFPQSFQKDCFATQATYALRDDGDLDVLNECRKGSLDGELDTAHGKAWIVDSSTNAKLKVRFFWPFSGDYWIIDLGENYEYSVVGSPDREYLWILSRTRTMDKTLYEQILARVAAKDFDLSRLQLMVQP